MVVVLQKESPNMGIESVTFTYLLSNANSGLQKESPNMGIESLNK